jgi:DNA-directed RNA polymerase subunit RPC12/RpoP
MNLRCTECGRQSYSASPDVVIRNEVRCADCGGELTRLDDMPDEDAEDDRTVSGA